MAVDTDHGQIDPSQRPRSRLVAWVPDFSAGSLSLILTVLIGFYHFGGVMTTITAEQNTIKAAAASELVRNKEAVADMKQSVTAVDAKVTSVQEKLGGLAVTIAEIRATQQQRNASK